MHDRQTFVGQRGTILNLATVQQLVATGQIRVITESLSSGRALNQSFKNDNGVLDLDQVQQAFRFLLSQV